MSLLLAENGQGADAFTRVGNVADLSLAEGPVLVPLEVVDAAIADGRSPLGLLFANNTGIEAIRPYFEALALVAVQFPSFSDGRGLSLARRLRREGFAGRLRAVGPLIADQFREALSCGFDEVELPDEMAARQPLEQWLRAKDIVSEHYQTGYGQGRSILQKRLAARGAGAE